MRHHRSVLGSTLACACLLQACGSTRSNDPIVGSAWVPENGAAIHLRMGQELEEIARLEDARTTGDGRLIQLLEGRNTHVRRRAAIALGRLPYPQYGLEVTEALTRALDDSEARLEAAFALGIRGDPAAAGVLAAYKNDPDPEMRVHIVAAASRIPDARLRQEVVVSLRDADLSVRVAAADGTARWTDELEGGPGAAEIDRALLDTLRPYKISRRGTSRSAVEAELIWHILYALSRRGAETGRGAFLEYVDSGVVLERLFALRGLARLPADREAVAATIRALEDDSHATDWRVSYEAAVALGRFGDPAGLEALMASVEHRSAHVRAAALAALGNFPDHLDQTLPVLRRGLVDVSPAVRAAALRAFAENLDADDAYDALERMADDEDPVVRLGAAQAARELEDPRALELLHVLTRDPVLLVSTQAVDALGQNVTPASRSWLHGFLAHEDNGMRLAAVTALRNAPDPSDVAPLAGAFSTSEGDVSLEVAFNVLRNLGAIGNDAARELVRNALDDPRPYVRSVARDVLSTDFELGEVGDPVADQPGAAERVPIAGHDFPMWNTNPMVEVATSRGNMVFELFPVEAPVHVFNFLELARTGAYEGLIFHRVVPDFVIQGGDYRGDGNGARPWRGEALRHEFSPRHYVRGSLGMPRNANVDSGGSQFFVTHRPTPHLDGRYTVFGELRHGGEVLDAIQVGDRILDVRIVR